MSFNFQFLATLDNLLCVQKYLNQVQPMPNFDSFFQDLSISRAFWQKVISEMVPLSFINFVDKSKQEIFENLPWIFPALI